MLTRGQVVSELAKSLLFKKVQGHTLMGFIVYRGIPDIGKIVSSVTDSMNEVHYVDLDDSDTMIYFMMVAGVDAQDLIGRGLANIPDTIVFELGRLLFTMRAKVSSYS